MVGIIKAICISHQAGAPMQEVEAVTAVAGFGLMGDRYADAAGSWNKGKPGKRQVTLMNAIFFDQASSGFTFVESRRNILVADIELMQLIGQEFNIGMARMRGVKYCDPCERPSKLAERSESFKKTFFDRGGLIADVIETGWIRIGDRLRSV